jgi:hypothetical protein
MTSIQTKKFVISALAVGLALFSVNTFADTDVVSELENKLMSASSAAVSASGLSGYTLKAAKFGGSFGATPIVLNSVIAVTTPFSATSQAICACTPGTYSLVSGSMGSVETGETFSSAESLSTDTTVTVEGNYGAVTAKATTNIKTNQETTSSKTSNTLSQSNVGSTAQQELTCDKYNQPQCFIGSGSTNQITYKDSQTGSEDINYTYDVFPVNNGSNDFNAATFTATLYKQGTTTAGNGTNFMLYDGNNKLWFEQGKNPEPTNCYVGYAGNDNALFTSGTYKQISRFNISQGGSPNNKNAAGDYISGTVSIRFKNTKDQWTSKYYQLNANPNNGVIPKGWRGSDLRAVEYCNNYYITTNDDTQTKDIKISSVIPYDTAKHEVTGTYNANDMTSLAMNVNYTQYSWSKLQKNPNQYTSSITACGNTLVEAKRTWKAACSSPSKKVLMFKKYVKENGPISLPGGGKLIGGKGQGGRDRK